MASGPPQLAEGKASATGAGPTRGRCCPALGARERGGGRRRAQREEVGRPPRRFLDRRRDKEGRRARGRGHGREEVAAAGRRSPVTATARVPLRPTRPHCATARKAAGSGPDTAGGGRAPPRRCPTHEFPLRRRIRGLGGPASPPSSPRPLLLRRRRTPPRCRGKGGAAVHLPPDLLPLGPPSPWIDEPERGRRSSIE
ncbi:unnamed protein product [Urochloa humidicola]